MTGTDTGVGKTVVTAALVRLARRHGRRSVGLKPVASGAERVGPGGALRNADALELQAAGDGSIPYEAINPYCFEPSIAPHLAAQEAGVALELPTLVAWFHRAAAGADLVLVEGAGGWRVPRYPAGFLSDLPEALGLDVLLVVGLRLGCLNHARLTAEAIERSGRCRFAGWIANALDPGFSRREQNVAALTHLLGQPPLAVVPDLCGERRSRHGSPVHTFPDDVRLLDVLGCG